VSSLGDVLELIFARPDPAVSVHAVVHEQRDREVADRVGEQFMKDQPGLRSVPKIVWLMSVPALAAATWKSLVEKVRRPRSLAEPARDSELTVWLDASGRARLERTWQTPGGRQRLTAVVATGFPPGGRGKRLFEPEWSGPRGQTARWPAPSANDVERLFSHGLLREIVACLELETLREDEVAGRPVVVVQAARRRPDRLWPHWLPFGAEKYELNFDREFGSLLAFRAYADGCVYESVAVTEITFGAPIDQRLLDLP
jgi:hypothetical protein